MGFKSIILSKQNTVLGFFLCHLTSSLNYQGIADIHMLYSMKKTCKIHITGLKKMPFFSVADSFCFILKNVQTAG